jgi:DNA-binding NtrC family response regulator
LTPKGARILIVDDERDICDILFRILEREHFSPMVANNGESALEMIRMRIPEIVLLDVKMPGMDGMEVLKRAKKLDPDLPVLMITAWGGIDGAVEAIKAGAADYIAKPLHTAELVQKIKHTLQDRGSKQPKPAGYDEIQDIRISRLRALMGPSDAVAKIVSEIALVAPSNFSVVIQGETGTGKELVARAIHEASLRSAVPIVPVDCGAIPETLFESELFGHEKGAFTGALIAKPGKFEMAQSGTLFLDEIANMPLGSQIKLLRAIQEKSFYRIGARKPVEVDVRLIVATNQDLKVAVREGTFSRDLFYRLSEFTIYIPPLRERPEDTLHIARQLLLATNTELSKNIQGFTQDTLQLLADYHWPGNVRQLRSAIRRAVLQAEDRITPQHLMLDDTPSVPAAAVDPTDLEEIEGLSLKEIVKRSTKELEKRALIAALRKTGGNKAKAARLLQIDYTTIHAKIKQYGIDADSLGN